MLGAFTGPIALIALLLLKPLEECPNCGQLFAMRQDARCPVCGYIPTIPAPRYAPSKKLRELLGISLSDRRGKVERSLRRRAIECTASPDKISFQLIVYGTAADIAAEFEAGRVRSISIGFPVDNDHMIYYIIKENFISSFGRPSYENFDAGYSDNWHEDDVLVTLNTVKTSDHPSTVIVFQKLTQALADAIKR